MAALRWAVGADRETGLRLVAALAAYWWLRGRRGEVGELAAALVEGGVPDGLEEEWVSCVVHAVPRPPGGALGAGERVHAYTRPAVAAPVRRGVGRRGALARRPGRRGPWLLDRLELAVRTGADGAAPRAASRAAQALDGVLRPRRGGGAGRRWRCSTARRGESADVLCHRADCRISRNDLDGAAADYRLAAELSRRAGRPGTSPEVALGLGRLARLRGDTAAAARHLDDAGDGPLVAVERARLGDGVVDGSGGARLASDLAEVAVGRAEESRGPGTPRTRPCCWAPRWPCAAPRLAGDPDVARAAAAIPAEVLASAYPRGAAMTREEALTALSADRR